MPGPLRILLHAPTAAALGRARRSAQNVLGAHPEADVLIVVNAEGAESAVLKPDEATDRLTVVCEVPLQRTGLQAAPGQRTTPLSTVFIAERQAEGFAYIRA